MARGDLKTPRAICIKGLVFVLLACFAVCLLLLHNPSIQFAFTLMVAIWASCRSYYFAFYCIEHYVDPSFQYAGLVDMVRYLIGYPRR